MTKFEPQSVDLSVDEAVVCIDPCIQQVSRFGRKHAKNCKFTISGCKGDEGHT